MSFRQFSRKFKKSFNKNLSRLAFNLQNDTNQRTSWNVLITGGGGHLAENLVQKLVENARDELRPDVVAHLESQDLHLENQSGQRTNARVFKKRIELAISRKMSSHIQIVLLDLLQPNEELLRNDYTKYINGSFTDYEIMKDALQNIDTVFHLAAVGMTGQYATDRKACMDINAVGTMNLLSWSRQNGVKRFIYSSSIGVVFNGEPLNNVTEEKEHSENFYNYYCESKAHAEIIVQNASCDELKTTVLRFNGIYGPGEKRVTERVVKFMLSGWWIAICEPNGIEAQTQLSSVDNCVQGLVKAEIALKVKNSKHGEIYNIMDRDPVGTFSFWTPLNQALGFTDHMINIPPWILKFGGFFCQNVANFFKVDPFMTSLEVDLLTVNNTFSIEKACEQIGYDPAPSSMPEIVEMYGNQQTAEDKLKRKKFFLWRMIFIIFAIISLIIPIVYFSWKNLIDCYIFLNFYVKFLYKKFHDLYHSQN